MEALREPKKLISSHLKELGIPKSVSTLQKSALLGILRKVHEV